MFVFCVRVMVYFCSEGKLLQMKNNGKWEALIAICDHSFLFQPKLGNSAKKHHNMNFEAFIVQNIRNLVYI